MNSLPPSFAREVQRIPHWAASRRVAAAANPCSTGGVRPWSPRLLAQPGSPVIVHSSGRRDARPTIPLAPTSAPRLSTPALSPISYRSPVESCVFYSTWLPSPARSASSAPPLYPISYLLSSKRRVAAFTLIELLVVISIIAILAALAFPAVNGAIGSARKAQARNDVQQIVAAVKAFQAEYGRMPTTAQPGNPANESGNNDTYHQNDNDVVMRILMAQETGSTPLNSKRIVFLDAKTTTSQKGGVNLSDFKFYDPWGTLYAIKVDNNYSGKIEYYGTGNQANIFSSAMAVSAGPDKELGDPYGASGTGKDDICSFK